MKSIFKDPVLAETFEREGYVLLDLLDQAAVDRIGEVLNQNAFPFENTFYSSSFISDKRQKQMISQQLEAIIDPLMIPHLITHKKLGAVFLIKPPGPSSVMPIHQDWTVVDETQYDAITVWIPLQDTNVGNGCIRVLPGSHRLSMALRAPTLQNPLQDILPEAEKMMQPLPMKAGQAFIFSHALLHASFPNLSTEPRIAVAYGVVHQEAQLMYYFREQAGEPLELLGVPEDFFLNYPAPGQRPEGAVRIKVLENYRETTISLAHFRHYYGIKEKKPGLWQRIRQLFPD